MSTVPLQHRRSQSAASLLVQFLAEGWTPGVPVGVPEWSLKVDLAIIRKAKCTRCHARGLLPVPFRQGQRLRLLGVCVTPACAGGEEF